MNYSKIYDSLIERARNRNIDGYVERHHVVPRCMGGSDDASNLVKLTPEEHYLAHLLLVKMYPTNRSLIYAAKMMSGQGNNKSYGWLKRRSAKLGFSDDHKQKISAAIKNRWENETLEQMQARWDRAEKKRQKKKDDAIITALIYSIA